MSLLLSLQIFKKEARDLEQEIQERDTDSRDEVILMDEILATRLQLEEVDVFQVSQARLLGLFKPSGALIRALCPC
jgi:hypothetical protein